MKNIKLFLVFIVLIGITGCSQNNSDDELSIVTSFFPLQSLVEEMLGYHVSVIIEGGGDPHDFEPTAKQRVAIAEADVFFYHGAGFEFWFNEDMVDQGQSIELSFGIDLLEDLDQHAHGHDSVDPHTWLDPNNAKIILLNIHETLMELYPESKESLDNNLERLTQEIDALINDYSKLVHADNVNMVVDHHAYGYIAEAFNLNQKAIIEGVADGDVSFKQTEAAIEEINDLKVKAIFVDPSYRNDIVDTIAKATGVQVLELYTLEQRIDDRSYLDMLRANYENLSKGLGVTND